MAPKSVPVPMIRRVRLKNFRSIGECDVELGPLTLLVGPNGSGKSNFLQALDFLSDALNNGLEGAVRRRGGMNSLLSRWALDDPAATLSIEIELDLAEGRPGEYALSLKRTETGGYEIAEERCRVSVGRADAKVDAFVVQDGRGVGANRRSYGFSPDVQSRIALTLPHHADHVSFGLIYRALSGVSTYSFHLTEMRRPRELNGSERLSSDGANIASVVERLSSEDEHGFRPIERVVDFLAAVSRGVVAVSTANLDGYQVIRLTQQFERDAAPLTFTANEMSNGTLHTLGVLVALYQWRMAGGSPVTLVGLEEPESAVHPGAATAILEAMGEASLRTQVIATTHSASMLDHEDFDPTILRAVARTRGRTLIGPIDAPSRQILEDALYSAGGCLDMGLLTPVEAESGPAREESPSPA